MCSFCMRIGISVKRRGYWKETKKDGKVVSKKWIPSVLVSDPEGTAYCLKMDVRKYYPTMVHEVLKERFRKLFKDKELIWLLDEIIDSISTCPATEENIEILTEFGMWWQTSSLWWIPAARIILP